MESEIGRKQKCPYAHCDTVKGPYFNIGYLKAAMAEHYRMQHANELEPMQREDRSDIKFRKALVANV